MGNETNEEKGPGIYHHPSKSLFRLVDLGREYFMLPGNKKIFLVEQEANVPEEVKQNISRYLIFSKYPRLDGSFYADSPFEAHTLYAHTGPTDFGGEIAKEIAGLEGKIEQSGPLGGVNRAMYHITRE